MAGLLLVGATAVVSATPAAADAPAPPPWVNGQLPAGTWVGYQLGPTSPPAVQRNPSPKWGPVTLTRSGNAPTSVLASEAGGWPSTWSSNGITLQRADQFCAITVLSCRYYVTGGNGQRFFFGASGGSNPPGGPDPAQFVDEGLLSLPPPPQLTANLAQPTGGTLPSAGTFTFNASANDGLPGSLDYRWTLTPANGSPFTQDGASPTFTPPSSIFNQNGQYCVTVVVTAVSDGSTASPPQACFAVMISSPTPAPPQAPPPQTPAAGGGAIPSAGPTPGPPARPAPAAPLSFAKPLPNFAVPVAGAVQQVTVIWLWKPDWFQSTAAGRAVRTAGRPKAVKRASVSVKQNANGSTPSAAPWLAGLGAFGIFGAGWLAFRRRSLRSSLLD